MRSLRDLTVPLICILPSVASDRQWYGTQCRWQGNRASRQLPPSFPQCFGV